MNWDESKHPRQGKGNESGGRFAPGGGGGGSSGSSMNPENRKSLEEVKSAHGANEELRGKLAQNRETIRKLQKAQARRKNKQAASAKRVGDYLSSRMNSMKSGGMVEQRNASAMISRLSTQIPFASLSPEIQKTVKETMDILRSSGAWKVDMANPDPAKRIVPIG